jgi:ATP-dependent DNA helicase PIF1
MPLILLRYLNPFLGLSNGTKLCLQRIHNHMIEVKIIGGDHNGNIVCLPWILLKPKDRDYPFEWARRQFPVNIAFTITINKSEGQMLSKAAIYLPEPCFAHGQLYTALSRMSHPNNILVMIAPSTDSPSHNQTRNIVYTKILEHNP